MVDAIIDIISRATGAKRNDITVLDDSIVWTVDADDSVRCAAEVLRACHEAGYGELVDSVRWEIGGILTLARCLQ